MKHCDAQLLGLLLSLVFQYLEGLELKSGAATPPTSKAFKKPQLEPQFLSGCLRAP
jgi:hypothetical protein